VPTQTHIVISTLLAKLRRSHQFERLTAEHALAFARGAVPHVEASEGQQVGEALADPASRHADRRRERAHERGPAAVAAGVPNGKSMRDEVARGSAGVGEAERPENEVAHRQVDWLFRDCLDHAPGNAEAGVVVAPRRSRRRDLHQVSDAGDEILQRFLPALGAGNLPFPSARVCEEVPNRHVAADALVADAEVR
jgi:hypothetical protein